MRVYVFIWMNTKKKKGVMVKKKGVYKMPQIDDVNIILCMFLVGYKIFVVHIL